ncbi:MAG: hypothetical protein GY909_18195 [Oligoflexia bacterium]|nr:hypothetical protein [Oligoflexia bacterium]
MRVLIQAVTIMLLFTSLSCGIVKDEAPDTETFNLEGLGPACPIETSNLAKILDEDISRSLDCLEDNLIKFTQFVRLQDSKEVKRVELEKFVNKFLSSEPNEVKKYLNIIFRVNALTLGGDESKISVKAIPLFMDLIRIVNTYGRDIKKYIHDINEDNYLENRESFLQVLNGFSKSFLQVLRNSNAKSYNLDILELLRDIKLAGKFSDDELNLKSVEDMLFLKRLILTGDPLFIDTISFERLISLAPQLVRIYFDVIEARKKSFVKESHFYKFLLSSVKELRSIIFKNPRDEVFFFDTDLINLLYHFVEDRNWNKIGVSIQVFKVDVIGGDVNFYNSNDIEKLFTYGTEVFESLFFFSHTFDLLEPILMSEDEITDLTFPPSEEYEIINQKRIVQLWHEFVEVTKSYRTFPQEDNLSRFSYQFNRSRWGYLLQSVLRYAADKLFEVYHTDLTIKGRQSVSKDQVRNIVIYYREILEEFDLWPKDLERLVKELVMGSDLFQYSSNGDLYLQKVEITQYLPTVIGANIIGKEVHQQLANYCDPDHTNSFPIECYREYFFDSLFYDLGKSKNFPNFYDYFKKVTKKDTHKYLEDAEKMARVDPDPILPMTKTDLSRLVTSMSNTEGLFLRYDKDRDGVLDYYELGVIYKVLENTLAEEANLKPGSKLLKSLFYFIVKKQKEPSAARLIWFHVFGRKKNVRANRNVIAGVLKLFGHKKDKRGVFK